MAAQNPSPAATRRSPLALAVLALLGYKPLHPYGVQRLVPEQGEDGEGQRGAARRAGRGVLGFC